MPSIALEKLRSLKDRLNAIDVRITSVKRDARNCGMKTFDVNEELHELYAQRNATLASVREVAARYGIAMA